MEVERQKSKGTLVVIVILSLVIVGLAGYVAYDKGVFSAKKENTQTNESKQEEKNDATTKVEEKVIEKSEPTENSYQLWASNLKEQFSKKFNSYTDSELSVKSEIIKDGYSVVLNEKGELLVTYWNKKYSSKYTDYKIASNVISYAVISSGQGGGSYLYFINEDGTVGSADTEYGVSNNQGITVKKDLGYKNIVSIISGVFGTQTGIGGTTGPIFIDINGNVFGINE